MEQIRKRCENEKCNKEIYDTESDACAEIHRIVETARKLTDVKPCRAFYCDCGFYALTSKPHITQY